MRLRSGRDGVNLSVPMRVCRHVAWRGSAMTAVLGNGTKISWLGHATTLVECGTGARVLIDPWVYTNPSCPPAWHALPPIDVILITHGHGDHLGDVLRIAAEAKPKAVIAIHEIAVWLDRNGVEHVTGMNRGGSVHIAGLQIAMVPAVHSSSIADPGGAEHSGGEASGFVITLANGFRVYHAGDTDLFGDMALIGEIHKPDLALLPIGDHYTMGPAGAARAARLLGVHRVIPIHWGTFPALTGTPEALRAAGEADGLTVIALKPGETLT